MDKLDLKGHTVSESVHHISDIVGKTRSQAQISVVIPVHNQEMEISSLLIKIKEILNSTTQSYEIVVVNDGSYDNTLNVLQKEELLDSCIRIISYTPNRGKGHAVKTGVMQASGSIIIFVDGDFDISHDKIKEYLDELKNCDLVIASKRHPYSKVSAPISRIFLSRIFNVLVRLFVGIKIKDTQSGLKAGNGDALRMIFGVMLVKRYAFDVELLTIATAMRLNIRELPIEINLDHGFRMQDIVKMLIDISAISYRHRITRWYQRQLLLLPPYAQRARTSRKEEGDAEREKIKVGNKNSPNK
ncbi:MAG TPA: glycosyltransferase [Nitrososphaeraceae archaeon]|nr:glycosyltransferase [Nitrososphaeraceae archaeon]